MILLLLTPLSFVEGVFVLLLVVVVIRGIREGVRNGRTGKHHAAVGNALMNIEPIFRPSRKHIIEAREHEDLEEAGQGDPPDTSQRH